MYTTDNDSFSMKDLHIGDIVPDMPLTVFCKDAIQKKTLYDYKGHWTVLFFYPADFTFVCPTELGELADRYSEFQKEGAEILSVSTDSAFSHKAWCEKSDMAKKISYPMISDTSHDLSVLFNVLKEDGMSERGTFILSPDMTLKAIEIVDENIGRNAEELLRKVKALKYTHTNKGEVAPAGWKNEGDKTLKPSDELIGNI